MYFLEDEFDDLVGDGPIPFGDDEFKDEVWSHFEIKAYIFAPRSNVLDQRDLQAAVEEFTESVMVELERRHVEIVDAHGGRLVDTERLLLMPSEASSFGYRIPDGYRAQQMKWQGYCWRTIIWNAWGWQDIQEIAKAQGDDGTEHPIFLVQPVIRYFAEPEPGFGPDDPPPGAPIY
jgi:hypothetical protein